MGLAQLSLASTGVPLTEMLVGGGPVGASAAAAPDPGGGAEDVRTGVPDCTARGAETIGVDVVVLVVEVPDDATGSGPETVGVEVGTGLIRVNCVWSDTGMPRVQLAVTS